MRMEVVEMLDCQSRNLEVSSPSIVARGERKRRRVATLASKVEFAVKPEKVSAFSRDTQQQPPRGVSWVMLMLLKTGGMGHGTAWGGRLPCKEDNRWVRIPCAPPALS